MELFLAPVSSNFICDVLDVSERAGARLRELVDRSQIDHVP